MTEQQAIEMTPEQVVLWRATVLPYLERLCKLTEEVCDRHLGWMTPSDCICGTGGFWRSMTQGLDTSGFRNAGHVIDFIESAVREKLERLVLKDETDAS